MTVREIRGSYSPSIKENRKTLFFILYFAQFSKILNSEF